MRHLRNRALLVAASLSVFLTLSVHTEVKAQSKQRIATFNVSWLMDQDLHTRWVSACKAVGWKDTAELDEKQKATLLGLPFCNVHNGLKFPTKDKCKELTDAEARQRPLVNDKVLTCAVF